MNVNRIVFDFLGDTVCCLVVCPLHFLGLQSAVVVEFEYGE